jgi:hypothetical protein
MGISHPGPVYTYSLLILLALGMLAGLGAAIGLWTWLGFVVTDVVFADRSSLRPNLALLSSRLWVTLQYDTAIALSYILLAGLLVLAPLVATGLRAQTFVALRRSPRIAVPVSLVVLVVTQSVYAYFWAQSTAFLIRPLWTVGGETPSIAAIEPLQTDTLYLALGVAVAALCRAGFTLMSGPLPPAWRGPDHSGRVKAAQSVAGRADMAGPLERRQLPWWTRIPSQALLTTLVLWGLLDSIAEAGLVFLLLCLIFAVRIEVIPRVPGLPTWIRRIPLILRILLCGLISHQLAANIVDPAVQTGTTSFTPLVSTLLASLAFAAVLLPGPSLRHQNQTGRGGR